MIQNGVVSCSFCGKSSEFVLAMVIADNANICNECIVLCVEIVLQQRVAATEQKEAAHE